MGTGLVEIQLVDEVSCCHPARARAHGKVAPNRTCVVSPSPRAVGTYMRHLRQRVNGVELEFDLVATDWST